MANENKFRATFGLDAAGEKVVNVATADRNTLTDGVNVAYFYQENTIQLYDPTRTYPKGFAVISNNRIWTAKEPTVVGPFNETYWTALRSDPKWIPMSTGSKQLESGQYVTVDTEIGSAMELTLPSNAQDGDTIVIKDIGGRTGITDVVIKAGAQSIYDRGQKLITTKMTVPYSEYVFVYVNRLWNLFNNSEEHVAKFVNTSGTYDLQSSDVVVRKYDRHQPINVRFPKNANNGDIIHFVGMNTVNELEPYFHLNLATYDANTSIIQQGVKSQTILRSLSGYFVFDASINTWLLFDSDTTDRLRTVANDTNLFPNETVSVVGTNNTDPSTITLTLPKNVESGAQITVALNYMRKSQTVNIVTKSPDKILTNFKLMQFPKRSEYPPDGNWVNTDILTFNGTKDYPPIITFAYIPMGPTLGQWMVVENVPQLERVDPTNKDTRGRLGVIALATQDQANLNWEDIDAPSKEVAITAETLANKTANKTRRGIARISTDSENALPTDAAGYLDDVIVSPKMLNNKQAREDMRGVAEIATQDETNASIDDQRIITPKKLDARRANPDMAGVAPVVRIGGVAPIKNGTNTRDTAGTGIYNHADYSNIVTPKTLREFKSTEMASGILFLANSAEVIAGTPHNPIYPLAVTPETLHTKTANDQRIGFSQVAKQDEVNAGTDYFKFVTPKTLNDRIATETLTGISKYAKQSEFDAGVVGMISEPAKIKDYFSRVARTEVAEASGLKQSGNLWGTLKFEILVPTETQRGTTSLATQDEVNAGVDGVKIVTSKTLHAKKSTETAEGIIQTATNEEVVLGVVKNKAVVPSSLINAIQIDQRWEATPTRRGTVKTSSGAITWVGDNVNGSTVALDTYLKNGYAISPYEFNRVLENYLPKRAKAVDSDLLDGFDSSQFVRRDVDQDVNGNIVFTKTITTNGVSTSVGNHVFGKANDGVVGTDKTRLSVMSPTNKGQWDHAINDSASLSTYKLKFGTSEIASFASDGKTTVQSLNVVGLTTTNTLSVIQTADIGNSISVNSKLAISTLNGALNFGSKTVESGINSIDANTIKANDASGNYNILTEKNYQTIVDKTFVKKSGDVMTGRLEIKAPFTSTIAESVAVAAPSTSNFGAWTSSITTKGIYDLMPGYVVPVMDTNSETGEPTGFISHYDEFKGPGTLTQIAPSPTSTIGMYQIWNPRPTVTTDNHLAQTFWIRSWNSLTNQFDGWGRMYTSNNPPTASEIGALSDNGNVISSLTVRDHLRIGHIKIWADVASRSVKFDWID